MKTLLPIAIIFLSACAGSPCTRQSDLKEFAREDVLKILKTPKTAQFSNEEVKPSGTGEGFLVKGVVTAQNSYGASVSDEYTVHIVCRNHKPATEMGWMGTTTWGPKYDQTVLDVKKEIADEETQLREKRTAAYSNDSVFYSGKKIRVKRLSGTHKYGGKTEVSFKPVCTMVTEERKYAKSKMRPQSELEAIVEAYISEGVSGEVRLDVTRTTIGSANLDNFTVIVHDSTDQEVFRKALDSDIPEYGSNDDWWNIRLQNINAPVRTPFYVYIVDQLEDAPFKFEVTAQ